MLEDDQSARDEEQREDGKGTVFSADDGSGPLSALGFPLTGMAGWSQHVFVENVNPEEAVVDQNNHVHAMRFSAPGRTIELPARSVFVAAGTSPNTMYEKEFPNTFVMDNRNQYFAAYQAVVESAHNVPV